MELREVMKSRRKALSITQYDLAEMAGRERERGRGSPSMATVLEILDVLGMEITYSVRKTVE